VSSAKRTRPPKDPKLPAACHSWRISSSESARPPLLAALSRSARAHRPAQAGERVGSEESAADGPFQKHAGEPAQVLRRARTPVVLDRFDGGDEIATGKVADLLAHEVVQPAAQARQRWLDVDDAAALEFKLIGPAFGQEHSQRGLIAHALGLPVGGGVAAFRHLAGVAARDVAGLGDRDLRKGADSDHAGATTVRAILEPERLAAARQDPHAETPDLAVPQKDLAGSRRACALHCDLSQPLRHGILRQRIDSKMHPKLRLACYGAMWRDM
jgi:hypothetical protein